MGGMCCVEGGGGLRKALLATKVSFLLRASLILRACAHIHTATCAAQGLCIWLQCVCQCRRLVR